MGEIKQTNFRIDSDTADNFRRFCEEQGLNQAQGFDHIMQVVELNRAKVAAPGRTTEIESFEKSVKDIMSAYLNSLEINANAEDRIKEQFSSALNRKDKVIADLQEKVDNLQILKESAEAAQADAQKALDDAKDHEKNALEQMDSAKKTAADQERINTMLTAQLADATEKLDGYDSLKESEAALKSEVSELKHKISEDNEVLSHTKEMYEQRLAESQAEKDRALEELKKDSENAAKAAQAKAELALERAVTSKERELNDQIRKADKENARLSAQIEQLTSQAEKENFRLSTEIKQLQEKIDQMTIQA